MAIAGPEGFQPGVLPLHAPEVVQLFERGIESTPYAWHGTSIEAIFFLAKSGHLPQSDSDSTEFFYAPEYLQPGYQEEQAKAQASWSAQKIYILQQLSFEPSDVRAFMYMDKDAASQAIFLAEAANHDMTARDVDRLVQDAMARRRGVVLGISEEVFRDFTETASTSHDQRSVKLPGGLPLKYITGIEPVSRYEFDQLVALQAALPGHRS